MDIPFHGMTEEEKAEVTVYIQKFIDHCAIGGAVIIPISAYNLNDEMFAINYELKGNELLQWKWIYRGEEGERLANERFNERMRVEAEEERREEEERNRW